MQDIGANPTTSSGKTTSASTTTAPDISTTAPEVSTTVPDDGQCTCTNIIIQSSGDAAEHQKDLMGVYAKDSSMYNGVNTYIKTDGTENLLFYGCQDEGCCMTCWNVGPRTPVKFMTSDPSDSPCPYESTNWKYWNHQNWHTDETLEVLCEQEQVVNTIIILLRGGTIMLSLIVEALF